LRQERIKMKWSDTQQIAEELYDRYPEIDPLTLRFTELHEKICRLEEFDDDPERSNERVLEAVLMAWLKEVE